MNSDSYYDITFRCNPGIIRTNIMVLFEKLGLQEVHVSGSNLMACCPFHDEHNPSFGMSYETGFYHCYGCGAKGNLVGMVMRIKKMNFDEAFTYLNSIDMAVASRSRQKRKPKLVKDFRLWPDTTLTSFEQKYDYLLSRGISIETQKDWEVCYSPDDQRYVVPVRHPDYNNSIIGFVGIADEELRKQDNTKKVKYTSGLWISQIIHNIHRLQSSSVILVEGTIDCMKVTQVTGHHNACAILSSNFNNNHYALLVRAGVRRIYCMYDNDDAGKKAYEDTVRIVDGRMPVHLVSYNGNDPAELDDATMRLSLPDRLIKGQSVTS